MADFKTHLIGAAAVSGVAATSFMLAGMATQQTVMTYFVLGAAGGLLPDIDAKQSIPFRVIFNLLAVVGAFVVVLHFGQRYSLLELLILWVACFVGVRYGICPIFVSFTVHRGLIHSIPAGALSGLCTTLLAYRLFSVDSIHAWLCGGFVFLGFVVHLLLDEIYSVNLMGMRLKRSFGSALNLGSLKKNPLGTLGLYLAVGVLLWMAPPADAVLRTLANPQHYEGLMGRLLPGQVWFEDLIRTVR